MARQSLEQTQRAQKSYLKEKIKSQCLNSQLLMSKEYCINMFMNVCLLAGYLLCCGVFLAVE